MTEPDGSWWWRRAARRLLLSGRPRPLALPPPTPEPEAEPQTPAPPPDPVPAEAQIPPLASRDPEDPERRARYFGLPYILPPAARQLARPAPARRERRGEPNLPLAAVATAQGPPRGAVPGLLEAVEPIRFSAFLTWHPEASTEVPEDGTQAWLLEKVLLARAIRLRDTVLHNQGTGSPPLAPAALLDAARRITVHPPTALLLCLTVTRAFARGGAAVAWRATDRDAGAFTDGVQIHAPSDGGNLFYDLFDPSALGTSDTGDWYRFFALATLAAITASGGCALPSDLPEGRALRLARRIDAAHAALRSPSNAALPAYRAWSWANALSFVEWGVWGRSPARALEAARIGAGAVRFGLAAAGSRFDPSWKWAVPQAGALRDPDQDPAAAVATWLGAADGVVA